MIARPRARLKQRKLLKDVLHHPHRHGFPELQGPGSNVAFWAHVGGFLVGATIAIAMYNYLPQKEQSPRQRI